MITKFPRYEANGVLYGANSFFCIVLFFLLISNSAFSQNTTKVFGKITDKESGVPIEFVSVSVIGLPGATQTDAKGNYELEVPAGKKISIAFL